MLKIGNLNLRSNLILAPMAGITDLPFRMLCRRFGCELAFVEMINCRSISHKSRRTKQMLSILPKDSPLGVQILGCEEQYILKALEVLRGYKFDLLDFNAACPAKKVVRRGEGAGLLKEPKKLRRILSLIVRNSWLPVSVKIRIGWDQDTVNPAELALIAQECGASALFIHGRTKTQGYSGQVDYAAIKQAKDSVDIPVIASGDIFSPFLANRMLGLTGCDGLAVARGSLGNPWIFGQVEGFLRKNELPPAPQRKEIIAVMLEHFDVCVDFYGEKNAVAIFRKFFSWYTKGFRKVRHLRERASRAKSRAQMLEIIELCRH